MQLKTRSKTRSTKDKYELIFLLDDFYQVKFVFFDNGSELVTRPFVQPKSQWLRLPDGEVKMVLTPEETALRAKAEERAILHVAATAGREHKTLKILGSERSVDGSWWVVVVVDTDRVDPPLYHLQIDDAGQVTKTPGTK